MYKEYKNKLFLLITCPVKLFRGHQIHSLTNLLKLYVDIPNRLRSWGLPKLWNFIRASTIDFTALPTAPARNTYLHAVECHNVQLKLLLEHGKICLQFRYHELNPKSRHWWVTSMLPHHTRGFVHEGNNFFCFLLDFAICLFKLGKSVWLPARPLFLKENLRGFPGGKLEDKYRACLV